MSALQNSYSDAASGDVATKSDGSAGVRSDTLKLTRVAMGFMIMAAGTLKVVTKDGTTLALAACAVGVVHPLAISQVFDTGTSVANANIILLYPKY